MRTSSMELHRELFGIRVHIRRLIEQNSSTAAKCEEMKIRRLIIFERWFIIFNYSLSYDTVVPATFGRATVHPDTFSLAEKNLEILRAMN